MTPTEQDKELRDILSKVLLDGQNQIYDLKDGRATPEQIIERMYASLDYWQPKLTQLITADRERVALEARIEALDHVIDLQDKQFSRWTQMDIANFFDGVGKYYRELKAQQEEV